MSNFVYRKSDGSLSITTFKEGDVHPKFDVGKVINSIYELGTIPRDFEVKQIEEGQPITKVTFGKNAAMFTTTLETPLDDQGNIEPSFDLDAVAKDMIEKEQVPSNYVLILKKIDNPISIIVWQSPAVTRIVEIETPLYTIESHHDDLKALGNFEGEEFIGYNIEVPADQTFFDAFVWDEKTQQIQIDMTKAKTITLNRLTATKNQMMQQLKLDLNVAIALEEEAEKQEIITSIKALKAADIELAVSNASTLDELKELGVL